MTSDPRAHRVIPRQRNCGSYRYGHDVHYIQVRLSLEDGPGTPHVVASVGEDGSITFDDGTVVWNHDPERLRAALEQCGADVVLGSHGVLFVPHGSGSYCFSVNLEPDLCRPETGEERPGESIVDELIRRGGVLRSGRDVLAELDGRAADDS